MKLHTGLVANSPATWLQTPEPSIVGITFRLGITDEPQKLRGITRLLLSVMNRSLSHLATINVGNLSTDIRFEDSSSGILTEVGSWLANPNFDHLEEVRAELLDNPTTVSVAGEHFRFRYGNVGPGREGVPELGICWINEKQLKKWVNTYFNYDNACLFSVGPSPLRNGIKLSDRLSRPLRIEEAKGPWDRPQWVPSSDAKVVSFSMILSDSPDSVIVRSLLELATDRCLSDHSIEHLAPQTSFDSLGNDMGQLVLSIRTDHPAAALAELRNLLSTLALSPCDSADLAAAKQESTRRDNETAGMAAYVTRASLNHLLDRSTLIPDQRSEFYKAYTPSMVADQLQQAWPTVVWQTAHTNSTRLANGALDRPGGVAYSHLAQPEYQQMTVGDNGFTYRNGSTVTAVSWTDIEAVVHTGEKERCLYAREGPPITLSSAEWESGVELIGSIDESLPLSRHIDSC